VEINEGDTCVKEEAKPITWATIQWPKSIAGYTGIEEKFYGRVNINGLTDTTENWDKSVALMGVKAQLCVRPKYSDMLYTDCNDAKAVVSDHSDGEAFGGNNEYEVPYTFENTGDYEYTFRFSTDNGNNWTWINPEWSNVTSIAYAYLVAVEEDKIPNGDFKYWLSDGKTPQLWTAKKASTAVWDRGDTNGYAVKLTASEKLSTQKEVFVSPTFKIPSDKTATAIKFDMATDQAIAIQIGVNCDSTLWYGWDSELTHRYFSNSTQGYRSIDFDDNNTLHPTSIQLKESLSNVTCSLEFRVTSEANGWAAFDNFEVVYDD
ncbi:hypothetical protein IKS86_00355, partial [bacterium]|nr:hypothetical protein [bacterium]